MLPYLAFDPTAKPVVEFIEKVRLSLISTAFINSHSQLLGQYLPEVSSQSATVTAEMAGRVYYTASRALADTYGNKPPIFDVFLSVAIGVYLFAILAFLKVCWRGFLFVLFLVFLSLPTSVLTERVLLKPLKR
jgi:hypothetical protein